MPHKEELEIGRCQPGFLYDDDARRYVPYESIPFTGPGAVKSLCDWHDTGGMRQRQHPTVGKGLSSFDEAVPSTRTTDRHCVSRGPHKKVCANGHTHWGATCEACRPACRIHGCTSRAGVAGRVFCSQHHERETRRQLRAVWQ